MAIASGLSGQFGAAEETTFGTYKAPTRFLEFLNDNVNLGIDRLESKTLRAGNRFVRTDRWSAGKKTATGPINFEVQNKGFGLLFKHMLGGWSVSTPMGATLTRLHTIVPGDTTGLSLSVQLGRPDTGGVVRAHSYLGSKIPSWTLANSVDGLLLLTLNLDAVNEDTSQALGAFAPPASTQQFDFTQGVVNIGGSPAGVVKDITINGNQGLKVDRYGLGSQLKNEQIPAAMADVSGEMNVEFASLTHYNRFVNGTLAQIDVTWTGSLIEGAFSYFLKVTLPNCRFDGDTPNVAGPDVLVQRLPFKALYDGAAQPITITYQTTDVAA